MGVMLQVVTIKVVLKAADLAAVTLALLSAASRV